MKPNVGGDVSKLAIGKSSILAVDPLRLSVDPPLILNPFLHQTNAGFRKVSADDTAFLQHIRLHERLKQGRNDANTTGVLKHLEGCGRILSESHLAQHLHNKRSADSTGVVKKDILPRI